MENKNHVLKRVLACVMVVIITLTAVPLSSFVGMELPKWSEMFATRVGAADTYTEGYYEYTVSDGEATITDCDESISGDIVIPDTLGGYPVTGIGSSAFSYCFGLTSLVMGDSIIGIADSAFLWCNQLKTIILSDSLEYIDYFAFEHCSSLTSLTIPGSVSWIGNNVFCACTGLKNIYVEESNTFFSSQDGVLFSKDKTGIIRFPIGNNVSEYTIPNTVNSIYDCAFENCSSLECIMIPDSVNYIGICAFRGCNVLSTITIPDGVMAIGSGAFSDTSWYNTKPSGDVYVGKFYYKYKGTMPANTSIVIKDGTKGIADEAFFNCIDLTSITVPDGVTSIGKDAFKGSGLDSITISDSVIRIGDYAFYCTDLKEVYYTGSEMQWKSISIGYGNVLFSNAVIHYNYILCDHEHKTNFPEQKATCTEDGYTTGVQCDDCGEWIKGHELIRARHVDENGDKTCDVCGGEYKNIIKSGNCGAQGDNVTYTLYEDGELVISGSGEMADFDYYWGDRAPYGIYSYYGEDYEDGADNTVKNVVIEDSVTSIGGSAFEYFVALESVTIPDSVTDIGYAAFGNCISITSITIPDGVTSIGDSAFVGCSGLANITIPDSVMSIGDWAFEDCTSLICTTIPVGVKSIGAGTFSGCSGLTSVTIPDGVTSIGDDAFNFCTSLTSISIPKSVVSVGCYTFSSCTSLTSIAVDNANNYYVSMNGVLFNKDQTELICYPAGISARSYVIPNSVTSIGAGAFDVCKRLTNITISKSVTSIGNVAFYGCSSLTSIIIPNGVTSMGFSVFYGCSGLTSITIPDGVTRIENGTFYGCSGLASIIIPDGMMSIGYSAFYGCSSLKEVNFAGNEDQWNAIEISDGNDDIKNAALHYNCFICYHNNSIEYAEQPATCTEDGYTAGVFCEDCETWISGHDVIDKLGHSFTNYVSNGDATCTGDGTKTAKCDRCDITDTVADTGSMKVHTESAWITDKESDCVNGGTKHTECTVCHTMIKTEMIPAKGHKYVDFVTAPTCTTDGYTAHTCSVCGNSYTDSVVLAKGHTESTDKAVLPTCTKTGLTEGKHCSVCGEVLTAQQTVAKTAHTNKTATTPATTAKDGKTVTACTICGKVESTVVIPKASSIKLSATSYTYNGKVKTPTVTVKDSKGKTLKKGTDYTVSYDSGRKNTGKYVVTVTLQGNYTGGKNLYFTILPGKTSSLTATQTTSSVKATWKAVTGASGYQVVLYSAKNKALKTVYTTKTTASFTKLAKGTTYKVQVTAYKTIDGKKVSSSVSSLLTTATKPGTPTLTATAGTKKAALKWNKQTGATGYVVYMATSKSGKFAKAATLKGNSKVSFTKTGLTKGKTYYFKVCAYTTVGGKTVYGADSAVKAVKVK